MAKCLFIVAATLLMGMGIQGEGRAATLEAGPEQTSLIELFTSEGCSSCPPADAWISSLRDAKGLWADFVPVAFHVNYWDSLGWKDRLATAEFTNRQRSYVMSWPETASSYTPNMVLNGADWKNWYKTRKTPAKGSAGGWLKAETGNGQSLHISYVPSAGTADIFDVYAVLLGFDLETDVKAGENRGKKLKHNFVALDLMSGAMTRRGESFTADLELQKPVGIPVRKYGVAVWITAQGSQVPLQAAGGYL